MKYFEHVTQEGDRWDLIANRYYGDAWKISPIVDANPDLAIVPVLAAGVRVLVPILDETEILELPPWKR